MATVPATKVADPNINLMKVMWEGFATNGDVGAPIAMGDFADRTVQVFGTFGTGGEITMEGSNDPRANPGHAGYAGSVWFPLTDPQGNAIVKTAASGEAVTELPEWVRPRLSAGSGTIDIDVILYMRGLRQ